MLRNPSLKNSLNLQHQIENAGPSSHLWTHASLSLLILSLMVRFQLMVHVQDKVNLLNEFFTTCFNLTFVPSNISHSVPSEASIEDALNRYDCTDQETEALLRGIKPHSATGPDGVTSWIFHSLSEDIAPSVSFFLISPLELAEFHQTGKLPCRANSEEVLLSWHSIFRPISLLSKCPAKHLYQLLLEHFQSNFVLSESQFGFGKGRCTIIPLMVAVHHWHHFLERKQVLCVFFDIQKEFDSVPHQALLNKLSRLDVPYILLRWVTSYLISRLQCVVLGGASSPWLPVKSGIPQGSILGPLLFLSFINETSRDK